MIRKIFLFFMITFELTNGKLLLIKLGDRHEIDGKIEETED